MKSYKQEELFDERAILSAAMRQDAMRRIPHPTAVAARIRWPVSSNSSLLVVFIQVSGLDVPGL